MKSGRGYETLTVIPECMNVKQMRFGVYEYSQSAGWKWAQKACFWFLEKIGAHASERVNLWTFSDKTTDGIVNSIIAQRGWVIEYLHIQGPMRIITGPMGHAELMNWCYKNGMQPFELMGRFETCTINHGRKIHDIPIIVIPWMKGAVIVPDMYLK